MQNLEEILEVKGVDMVQFGPVDYSISIGKPGQGRSPEVQNAHEKMIELALKEVYTPGLRFAGSNRPNHLPTWVSVISASAGT